MQISRMTEEERVEEEFTFRGAWLNLFAKFVNLVFAIATGLRNVSNVIENNLGDCKINLSHIVLLHFEDTLDVSFTSSTILRERV